MSAHQSKPTPAPEQKACCAPNRPAPGRTGPAPTLTKGLSEDLRAGVQASLTHISGGFFDMGGKTACHEGDLDGPPRRVRVSDFLIGRTTVTNRLFAQFVQETGYVTEAEREGWSFVFHLLLPNPAKHPNYPPQTPWWRQVSGATWSSPEGPDSSIDTRLDHPVSHVSWNDAAAFCEHVKGRLPHEAEWEYAARGGRKHGKFPWGNDLVTRKGHQHNVWQGAFLTHNTADDGFIGTAPADAFAPNGYGLHNMTGNVWEWCADWFGPLPTHPRRPPRDPSGAEAGPGKVTRGGSYLCHASYCERYYVHSRTYNTPDSSTGNTDFRLAMDT